jgi:hypothetical protein
MPEAAIQPRLAAAALLCSTHMTFPSLSSRHGSSHREALRSCRTNMPNVGDRQDTATPDRLIHGSAILARTTVRARSSTERDARTPRGRGRTLAPVDSASQAARVARIAPPELLSGSAATPKSCPPPGARRHDQQDHYLRCHCHFGPGGISMYVRRYHDLSVSPSGVWRDQPASRRHKRLDKRWAR